MSEDAANMDASATWDAAVQGWKDEGWNVEELSEKCFKLIYQNFGDIYVMVFLFEGGCRIQASYKGELDFTTPLDGGHKKNGVWWKDLPEPYAKMPQGGLAEALKANGDFQQYVAGQVNKLKGRLATYHRSATLKAAVGQHNKWKIWIWQLYVMACDLNLAEEGTPFIDVVKANENGDVELKLSNRAKSLELLEKTLARIGLQDKEINSGLRVQLEIVPSSEVGALPERARYWLERLEAGLDGSSCGLRIDYPGICEVVYEGGRIKVNSNADWKEEDLRLDDVTGKLSDIAEKRLKKQPSGRPDCLISYDDCDEEAAKEILAGMPSPGALEAEWAASGEKAEGSADGRAFEDLPEVKAWPLADILKWKLNLPAYQRPYVWRQGNVDSLWKDISEFKESKAGGGYDFGMIVLHKKEGSYDIVDGQQRLVTLALMLTALDSPAAKAFIDHASLQGKASEKNVASNLWRLMRKAARLADKDAKEAMAKKILEAKADVVVMDDIDETLKFFNRMNTAGVELSKLDILKSHHLAALADDNALSGEAKARWQGRGFVPDSCLDSPTEFRREVVRKWESGIKGPGYWHRGNECWLSRAWALRMMARGEYPGNLDDINDKKKKIDEFRRGNNDSGKYTGLDSAIQDGEFFFWYAFNLWEKCDAALMNGENYDARMAHLRGLVSHSNKKKVFEDLFVLLVVYLHEKFPNEADTEKFGMVVDRLFSWIAGLYLRYCEYPLFNFEKNLRGKIMKRNSPAMALLSSKALEDCFECDLENPLQAFAAGEWRDWGNNPGGGGKKYQIRRELRRIWQDSYR